jgi:hypothetical protein
MKKPSAALLVLALTVSSSALVAGCADENDPKTWVSRLDDAAKRPSAVKRLGQFFEDTMTKANGDRNDASVKALLDTIAEPMAKVYATGSGDEKTRRELLKILSDLQDARTAPAFVRAFQDYEPGRNDDEVKNATAAIVSMAKKGQALDPALADATFALFAKFKPSKSKLQGAFKGLHDAILELKSPSWGTKAVELLAAPVDDSTDSKLDEIMFRQLTAIQLIRELKEASAAPALVKVLLTPSKSDLRSTATLALLHIGAPAEAPLAAALSGASADWITLQSEAQWPKRGWVPAIAEAATMLGRPLVRTQALARLGDDAETLTNRALLAQFTYRFAPNEEALAAYKAVVEKTDPEATLEGAAQGNARATMLASATYFYDSSLVDWVVKLSAPAQKAVAKKKDDQLTTLATEADTAVKLMTKAQAASVLPLAKATDAAMAALAGVKGTPAEDKFNAAKAVVDRCDEKVECYLGELAKPVETGKPASAMRAVKSATMVAVLGAGEAAKNAAALTKVLASQPDPSARLASVEAIDFLASKGSAELADALEKLVESEQKAGQKNLAHDAMAKVAARLKARL